MMYKDKKITVGWISPTSLLLHPASTPLTPGNTRFPSTTTVKSSNAMAKTTSIWRSLIFLQSSVPLVDGRSRRHIALFETRGFPGMAGNSRIITANQRYYYQPEIVPVLSCTATFIIITPATCALLLSYYIYTWHRFWTLDTAISLPIRDSTCALSCTVLSLWPPMPLLTRLLWYHYCYYSIGH